MHSVMLIVGLIFFIFAASLSPSGASSEILVGVGLAITAVVVFHPRSNRRRTAPIVALDCHGLSDWRSLTTELAHRGIHVVSLEGLLASTSRSRLGTKPNALVLGADLSSGRGLARVRSILGTAALQEIPILAITDFQQIQIPTDRIRSHGIVNLLDLHSGTDRIVTNIEGIVKSSHEGRLAERTSCFIPVAIENRGRRRKEFALNLSETGMRLTSSAPLQRNQRVSLSFSLPMVAQKPVAVNGRVVYQTPRKNSNGRYEIGVAFRTTDSRSQRLLNREVTRLLTL